VGAGDGCGDSVGCKVVKIDGAVVGRPVGVADGKLDEGPTDGTKEGGLVEGNNDKDGFRVTVGETVGPGEGSYVSVGTDVGIVVGEKV